LIQSHYKGLACLKSIKSGGLSEEDIKVNNKIILTALKEIGVKNSMNINDFNNPYDRELLMFILELFFKLPN